MPFGFDYKHTSSDWQYEQWLEFPEYVKCHDGFWYADLDEGLDDEDYEMDGDTLG